jgi:hypothetical protein
MTRPINIRRTNFTQLNDITYTVSPVSICFGENSKTVAFLYNSGEVIVHKDYVAKYKMNITIGDSVTYRAIIYSIALSSYVVFFTKNDLLFLYVVNTKYTSLVSSYSSFIETVALPDTPHTLSIPFLYSMYKSNTIGKTTNCPILVSQSPLYLYVATCWAVPIVFINSNKLPPDYATLNRYYFQCFSLDIKTLSNPTPLINNKGLHEIQSIKTDGNSLHIVQDNIPTIEFINNADYPTTKDYLNTFNTEPFLPFNISTNSDYLYPSGIAQRTNCSPENTHRVIASDYCYWSGSPRHIWLLDDGTILEADESVFALTYTSKQGIAVTSTSMNISYGPIPWQTSFSIPVTVSCLPSTPVFSVENARIVLKNTDLRMLYNGSLTSAIYGITISPTHPFTFELVGYSPDSAYSITAEFEITGSFFKHY